MQTNENERNRFAFALISKSFSNCRFQRNYFLNPLKGIIHTFVSMVSSSIANAVLGAWNFIQCSLQIPVIRFIDTVQVPEQFLPNYVEVNVIYF